VRAGRDLNLYAAYAQCFPASDSVLLTTPCGERHSYGDAERYSAQVANYLTVELGLRPGDRVSVQVEKSPRLLWLFLGVLRAGLVFHPLNPAYTDTELDFFLHDAQPSLLVCDSAREAKLAALCADAAIGHVATLDADGGGSLWPAVARCPDRFATARTQADELAALVYSSGTTGRPKGIMLSHGNLESNARVLARHWGFTAADTLLHCLPVFHVHGLFVALGCVFMSGARLRWLPRFDAAVVRRELAHATVMMGVPTYYTRLLEDPQFGAQDCRQLRLFISGSAPLPPETFAAFRARTGHTILERYGMTETGMNTSNPLHGERRAGTVGPPLPGVEVRVCGAGGAPLPAGEIGDLQVRGPNVFCGYWRLPEQTAADFTADGFFNTGDKGVIDADGYVSIAGRSRDVVISGGLNVYPREIELLIDALPGVLESAVIGLPDADYGERVAAVVVPDGTRELSGEAVRAAVRERAAGFKVPRQVFFLDALPRNAMGKVQKAVLRGRFGER